MEQHGMSNTHLYRIWDTMKSRCNNPKHKSYGEYGGRGIRICPKWNSFTAFMKWAMQNGYAEGLTIDRITMTWDIV
jgi:NADPH-dependent 7-cyano-7-deazaguanine reductase QueF